MKYLIIISVLLLASCSPHRINTNPTPLVLGNDTYSLQITPDNSTGSINLENPESTKPHPWWSCFDDTTLNNYIEEGLDSNLTLAESLARLAALSANLDRSNAMLLPDLSGFSNTGWSWNNSGFNNLFMNRAQGSRGGVTQYGARLDWEVDLFGRLTSIADRDRFLLLAGIEEINGLKLYISSQIATTYFEIVAAKLILKLLNDQISSATDLLQLVELRFDAGIGANVDTLQQKSQLLETETLIPLAEISLRESQNRLDILLGRSPDGQDLADNDRFNYEKCNNPEIGIPLDLLTNRPDLQISLNNLIAADADRGRAIAERLPTLSIGGSYIGHAGGRLSSPTADLFTAIVGPIIDFGKRRAEVRRADAVYYEHLAKFSNAFLAAIEEVENTLYKSLKQSELIAKLDERQKVLAKTLDETKARYEQGLTDYLPVLNAIQELQTVERLLILEKLALIKTQIELHRAVGADVEIFTE